MEADLAPVFDGALVREAGRCLGHLRQAPLVPVVLRRVELGEGVADRAVAGAAAEVAADRLGPDLAGLAALAVVLGEEAHHEARRAVAALRAAGLDHRRLRRVQLVAVGEAVHGQHLAAGQPHRGHQARVHGEEAAALAVRSHQHHRAGTALALGAALLHTGQAPLAQEVEQRLVGIGLAQGDGASVDDDGGIVAHGNRLP